MKKHRIFVLIMTIIMLSPLLLAAGCGRKVIGSGSNDTRTVMTIDGRDVTYDEFRYFYLNYKHDMDGGDPNYWQENPEDEEELLENVMLALTSNYALWHIADELEVTLDKNEISGIDTEMEYTVKSYGGIEGYNAEMNEHFMTGDVYRSIIELQMLETKLRPIVTDEFSGIVVSDDATVEADIRDNFIRVQHILIINDEGDDINANFELAKELHVRAENGEDFTALVTDYSEDVDMDSVNGYYITRGEFLESFEDVAFELEVGEISDVTQSINGFHIIKRLEQEQNYIDENFSELRDIYKSRCFLEYRDGIADNLEVEYTELFGTLNVDSVI